MGTRPKLFDDPSIKSSDITPESVFWRRRDILKGLSAAGMMAMASPVVSAQQSPAALRYTAVDKRRNAFYTDEALTPIETVTSYNNYYEFGTDKSDPKRYGGALQTDPWSVSVEGLVKKPGQLHLEDILSSFALEERIYRFRCVEAWSMVVPWVGFPLASLLERFEPTSDAKYVAFETLYRPREMPGVRSVTSIIDWPYREGLRLDEAMNPLTLLAVGVYGKTLPPQNGAPIRLIVPWKYGFKSIKSLVKIRLLAKQPKTSWQTLAPREYGFYSNVNPEVDHPRWSQRFERRLPSGLLKPNRVPTQLFNGYAAQVAHLYQGMDLRKQY